MLGILNITAMEALLVRTMNKMSFWGLLLIAGSLGYFSIPHAAVHKT